MVGLETTWAYPIKPKEEHNMNSKLEFPENPSGSDIIFAFILAEEPSAGITTGKAKI